MELAVTRNSRRWALPLLLIGVVAGVSSTAHARVGWVEALAASPERIREGKIWVLFSSAALIDHPLVLSLLCFVALAGLTLWICGPRLFWSSALLGQIAATLLVYVFIGAARWIVPGAFDSSVTAPDFGVSAISAAWLGSLAAVGWRRHERDWRGGVPAARPRRAGKALDRPLLCCGRPLRLQRATRSQRTVQRALRRVRARNRRGGPRLRYPHPLDDAARNPCTRSRAHHRNSGRQARSALHRRGPSCRATHGDRRRPDRARGATC